MAAIKVRLDRLQILGWGPSNQTPPPIKDYGKTRDSFVRRQTTTTTYARCAQYHGVASGAHLYWQYAPQKAWLAPWKVTLVADDNKGVLLQDIHEVITKCERYQLLTAEIALDFNHSTGVDPRFIRRHAVFGKSRRHSWQRNKTLEVLRFGGRKSNKLVRCYEKDELGVFRVETELHSGLLQRNKILTVDDFIRLPELICPKHLQFVDVDWKHLEHYLVKTLGARGHRLLAGAGRRAASLQRLRHYLSRNGVVNIHRFLSPLALNHEVSRALRVWACHFTKDRYEQTQRRAG